jgi:hypothetical protein
VTRFNPHREIGPVLTAAAEWKDLCLTGDGSVFSPGRRVWTPENIARLQSAFSDAPDPGGDSFLLKLERQLQNEDPAVIQLAAELLWVLLLFPSSTGAARKMENVDQILSWLPAGTQIDRSWLAPEFLGGIGSPGTAFNTHRPRELAYLIDIASAMKALSVEDRADALSDPWRFAKFLARVPVSGTRATSHIVQYLLFPDTFERIASGEDKRKVIVAFSSDDPRRVSELDREARDRRLLQIRQELAAARGDADFDFYEPDLAARWQTGDGPGVVGADISSDDIRLLAKSRQRAKYADLSAEELDAYRRIHAALGALGNVVLEELGNAETYKRRLTSGYTPQSGVRGSLPKDLWFGVFAKANEEAFVGHPQLFMIVSERGLEYGFAALTSPRDFSNSEVKEKVRRAAPYVFASLPEPTGGAAKALAQELDEQGGWTFRRKERLPAGQTDFPSLDGWLAHLRGMTSFTDAGGNISRYLSPEELDDVDLSEEVRSMTRTFLPLMEQVRADRPTTNSSPEATSAGETTFAALADRALDQLAVARKQPFETVPELWATMTALVERISAFPAMTDRPHVFAKWSLGRGEWSKMPWIALMNRNVTTSTQQGFYVVMLITEDLSRIFLTLNQGMANLVKAEGDARAVAILKERAAAYRANVPDLADAGFVLGDGIFLGNDTGRSRKFQPSTIAYVELEASRFPTDEQMQQMLEPLLAAYDRLARADNAEMDVLADDSDEAEGVETAAFSVDDAMEKLFIDRAEFERIVSVWKRKKNLVLQGAPGVGKSYIARYLAYALMGRKDDARIENIQFHQSYGYEDFVQGFRPTPEGGFQIRDGVFHRFCRRAAADPDHRYVFIIDEMNRGNLSKILGELMLLLETDKRSAEHGTQLAYAKDGDPKFFVPGNVFVIGMMNTADRSLSMIDYALRRRFGFITLEPAFSSPKFRSFLEDHAISPDVISRVIERMGALNQEIGEDTINLGKGYRVGHSFFVPDQEVADSDDWYRQVIETEIAPLLEEYWFDGPEQAASWRAKLLAPS